MVLVFYVSTVWMVGDVQAAFSRVICDKRMTQKQNKHRCQQALGLSGKVVDHGTVHY
jgi:hypothetical protein